MGAADNAPDQDVPIFSAFSPSLKEVTPFNANTPDEILIATTLIL